MIQDDSMAWILFQLVVSIYAFLPGSDQMKENNDSLMNHTRFNPYVSSMGNKVYYIIYCL